jgi:hypothetical protein
MEDLQDSTISNNLHLTPYPKLRESKVIGSDSLDAEDDIMNKVSNIFGELFTNL